MWVHYGDKCNGCCVKVNYKFFSNFENSSLNNDKNLDFKPFDDKYRLYKVIYLKNGNIPETEDKKVKELFNDFIKTFNSISMEYHNYPLESKRAITYSITKIINNIIYLFKNSDYAYEKEMRIVLHRSISDLEREDIDIQTTLPTENDPIPKVFIYTKRPLIVEEIILGPKLNETDNLIPFISMKLLKMHNFDEEKIHITKSLLKYR